MKIFRARYLLPIASPAVEDGALLVVDGRIVAVGAHAGLLAAHPGAALVDFGETVILPPLVNAHTHLELTDFPQWAEAAGEALEPGDFVDWILRLVRVRRTVAAAAVEASLAHGLRQSLAAGTGAVGDILTTLAALPAYAGTPLSGRVFAEVLGVDAQRVAARLTEIAGCLDRSPGPDLAWGLSPHAPYTLTEATLGQAGAFAQQHRLPLVMHWAETTAELAFMTAGEGPIAERLYPTAGWTLPADPPALESFGGLLVHGAHIDNAQIDGIARTGQGVVLCPRSNSLFGGTRAPVAALRRAGVPLALGTDSRASSPSLSVWDELAFARSWLAGALDPQGWLELATIGGARALGLAGEMGRLAPGLPASFQVLAVPPGATAATLAEALCAEGHRTPPRSLLLRGENVLPHP
jgi:cytosine/adenosine deaminase-related metal-dependent hydrolase